MKIIKIAFQIALLYCFYVIGTFIQNTLHLFIPGSIIAMVLFLLSLRLKFLRLRWIEEGSQFLIKTMPLFFIPATVGIINFLPLFSGNGVILVFITLFSTCLVMVCSAHTAQWILQRKGDSHD